MSELKRTFTGGKMNKDLDERFVPKNQYRHATNIQVRQSDSDASGTVQNLQGNVTVGASYYSEWMDGEWNDITWFNSGAAPVADLPLPYYWKTERIENQAKVKQVCLGSVSDEKNDNAYFFFTDPEEPLDNIFTYTTLRKFIDNIVEQNITGPTARVVNDHWATTGRVVDVLNVCNFGEGQSGTGAVSGSLTNCYDWNTNGYLAGTTTGDEVALEYSDISGTNWTKLVVKNGKDYRVGMTMHGYAGTNIDEDKLNINGVNPKIKSIKGNILTFEEEGGFALTNIDFLMFKHERALNFQIKRRKHITGLNVIDNLLFWTDSYSEPKKINIDRCKAGTLGNHHTKLFIEDTNNNNILTDVAQLTPHLEVHNAYYNPAIDRWLINSDIQESHLTVLRKAPTKAPTIVMSDSERESLGGLVDIEIYGYSFTTTDGEINEIALNVGDTRSIVGEEVAQTQYRKDDILTITEVGANQLLDSFIKIKVKFICYEDIDGNEVFTGATTRMRIVVISMLGETPGGNNLNWSIELVERTPLFETKFCRFGYRYKYEDGEYSSFSPWSRIAFLPGKYDYSAKNGYNLGMTNNVRELIIKDFIPHNIPLDVVGVDILYKATNNANVYIAQTITKNKNSEWDLFKPTVDSTSIIAGELYITSEMIHRVLPEMQTFRSWDNVPRHALAQEIIGNRLLYANYFQGYNMENPIRVTQVITSEESTVLSTGYPSIKSLRNYKMGVVFGDKYGRETPVFTNGYIINDSEVGDVAIAGDLYTNKTLSATKNKFEVSTDWTNPNATGISIPPPDWLVDGGYMKYFIKETSNEYYNLVLDRWYDSGDESIWLSFNSADRNKVDEETHLILKNQHSSNLPVYDKARYKVLAIENEAPDYVRTRYINLGEVNGLDGINTRGMWIVDDQANAPNSAAPAGLYTINSITPGIDGFSFMISFAAWNAASAGWAVSNTQMGNIFGKEVEGDLEMQIIGRQIDTSPPGDNPDEIAYTVHSDWRKISNFNKDDFGVRFVWTKAFTDTDTGGVNMFGIFDALGLEFNSGGYNLEYSARFRSAIKENRPEFDGKFFVKINKDSALIQHVLELAVGMGGVWVPEQTYRLSYIDSQYMNPAVGDMGSDPYGGEISASSSWDGSGGLTNWYNNFDELGGETSYWSPPLSDSGLPDPYFFDAPYWSDELGPYGSSTNTPIGPGVYVSGESSGIGYGDGWESYETDSDWAYLNTDYYGWIGMQGEDGQDSWDFSDNGVSPYMPFVPLEYMPGTPEIGNSSFLEDGENPITMNTSDSIWGWPTFVDWCTGCNNDNGMIGLQFVPGAGGPLGGEQGVGVVSNPYGAGLFGGTCGPMFDWYHWNDKTKDYWQDYATTAGDGNVFMDGAGARRYITTIKNDEAWPGEVVKDQSGNIIPGVYYYEYYKPMPIERGIIPNLDGVTSGTPDNHFGRMNLGVTLYNYKQSTAVNRASTFFDTMTTVGTVFRFGSDPNADVFKVIWVEEKAYYDDNSFGGPSSRMTSNVHSNNYNDSVTDGYVLTPENNQGFPQLIGTMVNNSNEVGTSQCPPMETNSEDSTGFNVGRRLNRAIEFRKVNLETGGTSNEGLLIDPESTGHFDPRAHIRHDGSSFMDVHIMRLGFDYDSSNDDSLASTELGACFETEPKEDVGLDLYYEASSALPVVLTRDNILNYAPVGSPVHLLRRTASGNMIKKLTHDEIGLSVNNIFSKKETDNSAVNSRGVIVSLHKAAEEVPTLFKGNIRPADTIVFRHNDGVETQSKIINFVEPISVENDDLTASEYESGITEEPRSFRRVDDVSFTLWGDPNEELNGGWTIGANSWDTNYSDIDLNQLQGALVHKIQQGGIDLVVPYGIYIQNIQINAFLYDDSWYHMFTFGGDPIGWLGTPLNTNPVNGLALGQNATFYVKPRTGYYEIDPDVWKYPVKLGWFNCYGFGNGVESDRVRDDFNAPQLDNGNKVSTTITGYGEENKGSGIIYSGLYNSTSQMNDLNQFNMAEKITKDLNPTYGAIQNLKTRDSDVVVLTEDKVLKIIANKDAVYNADGNPQLVATNRVLGTAIPFVGNYGISKNPESLVEDQYRMYFTDKQRGAVLRLSRDGLTPISNVGMKTWFRNQLRKANIMLGTFDTVSGEYNLTLDTNYATSDLMGIGSAMKETYFNTISFSEESKGWVSFKSFVPESGTSVSGSYITAKNGRIWKHYAPTFTANGDCTGLNYQFGCADRNSWYGDATVDSEVIMVFNDQPSIVKSFKTIDYEGSQAKITKSDGETVEWKDGVEDVFYDGEYTNLIDKDGWWAEDIQTDLEKGKIHEFKQKEGKWFHQIGGLSWDYGGSNMFDTKNLNVDSFDIQGLGFSYSTLIDNVVAVPGCMDTTVGSNPDTSGNYSSDGEGGGYLTVNFNPDANYNVPSDCVYYGCSDNRKIGIDVLQDNPSYGPGTNSYGSYFASNYIGDDYPDLTLTCENDGGQTFNPNNLEGGWVDASDLIIGPWTPSCCEYYGCIDSTALNYVGDGLAGNMLSCTSGLSNGCEQCVWDCGGGNIPGIGWNATCGCNNPDYIEYWDSTEVSTGIYNIQQPELLTSYNNEPYHYNDIGACLTPIIYGCTDVNAYNYDYENPANVDDGSCTPYIYGCIDQTMTITDPVTGEDITVPTANYCVTCNQDDGSCEPTYPEGFLNIDETDNT